MKEEMVFNIASITKQFTAVAILQLMELGKLSLQDEIKVCRSFLYARVKGFRDQQNSIVTLLASVYREDQGL